MVVLGGGGGLLYHSTLGSRVVKKKKSNHLRLREERHELVEAHVAEREEVHFGMLEMKPKP